MENFGYRLDPFATHIDIEYGDAEIRFRRQFQCISDIACFRHNIMAKLLYHASNHHPNHRFVFNQKYRETMGAGFRQNDKPFVVNPVPL